MREVEEDIAEGADLIIAKPAMAYMDIIKDISTNFNIPVVAYNVSGEYAMVKAAAANGWIDEKKIVMENMIGMKRAGAKMIIGCGTLDTGGRIKMAAEERSKAFYERAVKRLPGGVNSPVRAYQAVGRTPVLSRVQRVRISQMLTGMK